MHYQRVSGWHQSLPIKSASLIPFKSSALPAMRHWQFYYVESRPPSAKKSGRWMDGLDNWMLLTWKWRVAKHKSVISFICIYKTVNILPTDSVNIENLVTMSCIAFSPSHLNALQVCVHMFYSCWHTNWRITHPYVNKKFLMCLRKPLRSHGATCEICKKEEKKAGLLG